MASDRIDVTRGDITRLDVDAVVNAANKQLTTGGGVAGAIHRAAGPGLDEECAKLGGCETGEAKITGGHDLPARWIIHTVGPVWHGGEADEDALLAASYRNSLELAREKRLETVAFPAISTGAFGFPADRATRIAVDTVTRFLDAHEHPRRVLFVVFGADMEKRYRDALAASG